MTSCLRNIRKLSRIAITPATMLKIPAVVGFHVLADLFCVLVVIRHYPIGRLFDLFKFAAGCAADGTNIRSITGDGITANRADIIGLIFGSLFGFD